MGHDEALKFTSMFALSSPGSDGAQEFSNRNSRRGLIKTNQLSSHLVQPNSRLEAERDGNGGLAVGSAQHDGGSFSFGNVCTNEDQVAEFFSQQHDAVPELESHRCVNDVVGCGAEVDAPAGFSSSLSHGFGQRHDVVPRFRFDFAHAFF